LIGARVILDIHDIVPEFYASKFKVGKSSFVSCGLLLAERLSAAYSNHVIISNHIWYKTLTQRSVSPEKCTAIINYPDLTIFSLRPRGTSRNGDFVMCYPGTLNWHQGLDLAVRAVSLLREKVPQLKFLIIGDGPDREKLATLVKELHLEDRVVLKGFVPIEEVADTMANVDLGVVPKRNDSFGNEAFSTKIMEFMAMGVPVVAAQTCVDQYYFNDRLVQFFQPEDVEDLAAKILGVIRDRARQHELSANGLEFIAENNWGIKKDMYLNLVDQVITGNKS
jgi:glycosyltransferase involved in cell wall biosynthesis